MEKENTIKTSVWMEDPSPRNPFYPDRSYCHGYDFYHELLEHHSWEELTFLHMRGELPDSNEKRCFSLLLASVMNSGPRSNQNRAAMSAAVGGCPPGASLMAGMGCSQGDLEGGGAVESCMNMLLSLAAEEEAWLPQELAKRWGGGFQVPGFGLFYGEKERNAFLVIKKIRGTGIGQHRYLSLFKSLEVAIREDLGHYIRIYGVFAAGLLDLGFSPPQGHGLYMIASASGMLTHLCERYDDHWTEYPHWFKEGEYVYEPS